MRHPSENFIRYLFACGLGIAEVTDLLRLYSLPVWSPTGYLPRIYEQTEKPPKSLHGKRAYFRKQKLYLAYSQAKEYREAFAVLTGDRHNVKKGLELCIMGGLVPEEAAEYLYDIYSVEISPRAIKAYRYYFWNRDLLDLAEWKLLLTNSSISDFYLYLGCMTNGKEHTLWKLGYREELDIKEVAEAGMHEAAMRFMELHSYPNTKDVATTATLWTDTLLKYKEIREEKGSKLDEVITRLQGIKIRLDSDRVASVDEVTSGINSETRED